MLWPAFPAAAAEVRVHGASAVPAEEVARSAAVLPQDPAIPAVLRAARARAQAYLRGRGYLEARVDGGISGENIELTVEEGPLYAFGETAYRGLDKLPPLVLERERAYASGDPYDRRLLFDTRRRLFLTGLFEDLRVDASTTSAKTADVVITVKERPLKWLKGGLGWGSEESQRVTLQLIHENLFKRAYKGELTAQWSRIWLETRADLVTRYLFKTRTQLRTSAGWRREVRDGYSFERLTAQAMFGRALSSRLSGNLGYQFERTVTFDVNPQIAAVTPDLSDGRSLLGGVEWAGTDDLLFPSRGLRARVKLQRTGGGMGGTIHFNKASLELKDYQPLGGRWTAAFTARGGVVRAFPPSAEVPVFDRFFMGGANSVRGYSDRGLGPKDDLGSPLGGDWMTGGSVEIRFPVYKRLMGAVFTDGGAVAPARRAALPSEWLYGAGAGIRIVTPVGPIRLDYGRKLNPLPGDPDRWRVHLSLGEAF